ncbi:hypothetical protein [Nitrospira sp. Nam74]
MVQSETKLIPALTIAERYDSNVFFIQGKNLEDYVTTFTPQLRLDHSGRLISGSLLTSLTGEYYVKNPGFNYIAPSAALNLNLDDLIGQLDRKAKLKVSDNFMFTPKPLAFIGPESGSEVPDTFVRGIQASRANALMNMAMATAAYQFTPGVTLQGTYTHSIMRFGTVLVQPSVGRFFDTTFQNYSIGPQFQVTALDVLSLNYQGSRAEFGQDGVFSSSFKTQGGTLGWNRKLTSTLTGNGSVGLTQIGSGSSATITYVVDASLQWQREYGGAMLRYSRSVFPSFFVVAVPLLSQVITVSTTYNLSGDLSLTGSANYARNESTSGQIPLNFDSYALSMSLSYTITRSISAIGSFTHSQFSQSFSGSDLTFNRNVASLSLRGEWN